MNRERRKQIADVSDKLEEIRAQLENLCGDIEEIRTDEEEYKDCIPENMQGSERYEKAESAVDSLYNACDVMEELYSGIDEIMESLKEATQ